MEQRVRRVVVAIGGNAIAPLGGSGGGQGPAVATAMRQVAELVSLGHEVVLTHGNGPQVGHLVAQNERAGGSVPKVPLDVCVAQTQGSIGLMMVSALEKELARVEMRRSVAAILTRVRVSPRSDAWVCPTKPIGGLLDADQNEALVRAGGQTIAIDDAHWRRVVASPEPLEVVDLAVVEALLAAGVVPIVAGGGGVPGVRAGRSWRGVEAVLDKDLTAALLGRSLAADCLVIATNVPNVILHYGRENARPLHRVTVTELRGYAASGHFPPGSMGPKVEAAVRFVEGGGRRAVITSLDGISAGVAGATGMIVEREDRAG